MGGRVMASIRASLADAEAFRSAITRTLGLTARHRSGEDLAQLLQARLEQSGAATVREYLAGIAEDVEALSEALTISESYFFRNQGHMQALPALLEELADGAPRRLRILSAGCSRGQEPYSLAIMIAERPGLEADILGVDLRAGAIADARAGSYGRWSLRGLCAERLDRFFEQRGARYQLKRFVRRGVRFQQANLAAASDPLWAEPPHDLILCRNALMYLEPNAADAVIRRLHDALSPGGYLVLGHAETMSPSISGFEACRVGKAFCYRRRPSATGPGVAARLLCRERAQLEQPPVVAVPRSAETQSQAGSPSAPAVGLDAAMRAIALSVASPQGQRGDGGPRHLALDDHPPDQTAPALEELLAEYAAERFSHLETLLAALPASRWRSVELLLLAAANSVNRGDFARAEVYLDQLAELDPHCADSRLLQALADAHAGEHQRALALVHEAIYLDASFAMAHIQLGRLHQALGNEAGSRAAFEHAAGLLREETERRLTLFGGGFSRDTLISLCHREGGGRAGRPA